MIAVLRVWCLCLLSATAQGQTLPVTPHDLDFEFAAGGCELGVAYCEARAPQSWEPREIQVVRSALDEIAANPLGRAVIARARAHGYLAFRRFRHYAVRHPDGRIETRPTVSASAHTSVFGVNSIDVNDLFFNYAGAVDGFSGTPGYALPAAILLHELVHGMDQGTYSESTEFRERMGLAIRSEEERRQWARFRDEKIRLLTDGQYEAAWRIDRTYAITILNGRLPTMAAVQDPVEAFAEIGAHLVLDPNAPKQIDPRVVDYFNDAVSGRVR